MNNKIDLSTVGKVEDFTVKNEVINLTKPGAIINLTKAAPTLVTALIGLGWTSPDGKAVDLDLSAFCLDKDGISSAAGFLFYRNESVYADALKHSGDDRDGTGEEDDNEPDEVIVADLSKIPHTVSSIVFVATVHEDIPTGMKFSAATSAFMNISDQDNKEVLRFDLSGDKYGSEDSVEFIRLDRKGDEWEVKAVADGSAEGLEGLVNKFIPSAKVITEQA